MVLKEMTPMETLTYRKEQRSLENDTLVGGRIEETISFLKISF